MILVITHKRDFTADYVINKFNERGIPYRRLNCEDILETDFRIEFNGHSEYSLFGNNQFKSVWFRRTKLPDLDLPSVADRAYILREIDSLFSNLYEVIESNWLSSPHAIYRAENKLLQLRIASNLGFCIPPTIVTSSAQSVKQFARQHDNNIIVKPISQTRIDDGDKTEFIFTSKVSDEHISKIGGFDLTPCIIQKNIEKDYELRVTVVGNDIFAAAIDSQSEEETKYDWRKKQLKFKQIEIPSKIQDLCRELLASLDLKFGAIDLIKTPQGEYIFLEINPNGQWVWIENQTGLRISESIIKFLTK